MIKERYRPFFYVLFYPLKNLHLICTITLVLKIYIFNKLRTNAEDFLNLQLELKQLFPEDKSIDYLTYEKSRNVKDPLSNKVVQRINSSGALYRWYESRRSDAGHLGILNLQAPPRNSGSKKSMFSDPCLKFCNYTLFIIFLINR